ncbi:hypothetical protein [Amycolatopsis cihanbeyliensis]|uniref:Excreted virulence factor EspC (Type VII ESX diderm) n=1 Tax=Amycolatopsis cihanbeyliensis TaxID=1128664 RepID=A0A542DMA2_AMYCI|nr:hypothetical protein [Amycolatopsis cihanbeyliensis]TQJ04209.1 hypothetical protein FB471_3992 [Amycolatopsis cihanbeyliensis]
MSGYQVLVDKITEAGRAAAQVADGMRGVACAEALPEGDSGMPGARCASKLAAVKQAWQGREQSFIGRLDEHAGSMRRAAQLYSANEDAAEQDLMPVERSAGGRRPF